MSEQSIRDKGCGYEEQERGCVRIKYTVNIRVVNCDET